MTSLATDSAVAEVFSMACGRPQYGGIYRIVCLPTLEIYIGQAANFDVRWRMHRSDLRGLRHHNRKLSAAVSVHGVASLEFSIIETCDLSELDKREMFWIRSLKPKFNGRCPYLSPRKPRIPKETVTLYVEGSKRRNVRRIRTELCDWAREVAVQMNITPGDVFRLACEEFAKSRCA
jgi:hypothetical protein